MKKAFTLVELLIVIALIAILSVAVLATINPIEQTNKARDAAMKNDAAEVLSALERYYASQNEYPWNSGSGTTVPALSKIAIGSTDISFGVGVGGSGALITTSELKSSFAGKDSFKSGAKAIDLMYLYHNGSDSSWVCYIPKAKANRMSGNVANPDLKCMNLEAGAGASLTNIGTGCTPPTVWSDTSIGIGASNAVLLCVPEGDIQ